MTRWELAGGAVAAALGFVVGLSLDHDDPKPPPRVELSTEVVLDAATIEIRGYGPDGELGEWVHDCEYEGERLVCTQRSEP
jgi:hypothetical protein